MLLTCPFFLKVFVFVNSHNLTFIYKYIIFCQRALLDALEVLEQVRPLTHSLTLQWTVSGWTGVPGTNVTPNVALRGQRHEPGHTQLVGTGVKTSQMETTFKKSPATPMSPVQVLDAPHKQLIINFLLVQ